MKDDPGPIYTPDGYPPGRFPGTEDGPSGPDGVAERAAHPNATTYQPPIVAPQLDLGGNLHRMHDVMVQEQKNGPTLRALAKAINDVGNAFQRTEDRIEPPLRQITTTMSGLAASAAYTRLYDDTSQLEDVRVQLRSSGVVEQMNSLADLIDATIPWLAQLASSADTFSQFPYLVGRVSAMQDQGTAAVHHVAQQYAAMLNTYRQFDALFWQRQG